MLTLEQILALLNQFASGSVFVRDFLAATQGKTPEQVSNLALNTLTSLGYRFSLTVGTNGGEARLLGTNDSCSGGTLFATNLTNLQLKPEHFIFAFLMHAQKEALGFTVLDLLKDAQDLVKSAVSCVESTIANVERTVQSLEAKMDKAAEYPAVKKTLEEKLIPHLQEVKTLIDSLELPEPILIVDESEIYL